MTFAFPRVRAKGIPGVGSERKPALGRLEQLVGEQVMGEPVCGPLDYQFAELVKLRTNVQRAANYVAAADLPRLESLEDSRATEASRAFAHAQLPGQLVEFRNKGIEHNLLIRRDIFDSASRHIFKSGAYLVEYADHADRIQVDVSYGYFGRYQRVLGFEGNVHGNAPHRHFEYSIKHALPSHVDSVMKLPGKLDRVVKQAEEAKARQATRQHLGKCSY